MKVISDDILKLVTVFFGTALLVALGAIAGQAAGVVEMQREAVKKGVAEYYLDEKHERQWRWKEAK